MKSIKNHKMTCPVWIMRGLFLICMVFVGMLWAPNTAEAATKAELKEKLEKTARQEVCKFYCADLDKDGKKEAVGITGQQTKGEKEYYYQNISLWYVSDEKCYSFYSREKSSCHLELWKVKGTYMFRLDYYVSGPEYACDLWLFDKNGPKKLDDRYYNLKKIGKNQFTFIHSTFDSLFEDHYLGHTWKQYYMYWNGKNFVEYGGIKITVGQLKKATGASTVLKEIQKRGWTITDILYRGNNIININCREGTEYVYDTENVTLKLKGNRVYYDITSNWMHSTSPEYAPKTRFEKANYIGIYQPSSSLVKKVTYPKAFPLG